MKRSLFLTFLMLLLTFGVANAANDVTVAGIVAQGGDPTDPDYAPGEIVGNTVTGEFELAIAWENDVLLQGASIPLAINTTGDVVVKFIFDTLQLTPFPIFDGGAAYPGTRGTNGLDWKWGAFGPDSDTGLVGGAWSPPGIPGVNPGPAVPFYFHRINIISGTDGTICIDSVPKAGAAGDWLFDDGTGNINPTYNGGGGSMCFSYELIPCQAPEFTATPAGDVLSLDHCTGGSFDFEAIPVEDGATLTGFAVVDDGGLGLTMDANTGVLDIDPADPGTYTVVVSVSNTCPQTTQYTFDVVLTNAGLQFTNCPTGTLQFSQNKTVVLDLGLDNFDCDPLTETVTDPGVTNAPTIFDGVFTWDNNGDVGIWDFTVTADDGFGESATCDIQIEVLQGAKLAVTIEKIGDDAFVFQGSYATLPITLNRTSGIAIGGYDLLIAYDASALTFVSAELGTANECWEYFTYRFGPFGNCGSACPSGLVELIAMREANDGPNHPEGCDGADGLFSDDANIANIKFFVTDDRTYECQYVPVYFYWLDCTHNAFSDITGNDLYISSTVWGINWVNTSDPYYQLIPNDGTVDEDDFMYGAWDICDDNPDPEKPTPIRDIDFFNGGVDIACADSIDKRGDLNLNNLANEIADAVLYTNYFIYGPPVFTINLQGQIAASDVNNDGRVLTVGDLVYLIRILTGDAVPFTKLSPFASDASVRMAGDVVSIESGVNVGAALFVFKGEADVTLLADNMEMVSDVVEGETRTLVWSRSTESIEAGLTDVLQVNGDVTLTEVEASDYYGNMVNTDVVTKIVPKNYALLQNYPNPFNPTTEVAFDLPNSANWTLDVYNIAGQLVKSFSGYNDAGTVKVNIDANGWASGIYFYRLQANDFMATKKMVLMK